MAEELYFPPIGPDVGVGQEYTADNGVTYTWRPEYSSWMIGSSQQVNKDYVDSRDQLRLRVDGGNHMYGDIIFRETADSLSEVTVELTRLGILKLSRNKEVRFVGDGGKITVSGVNHLGFSNSEVRPYKTVRYDSTVELLQRSTKSGHVTLFEHDTSGSYYTTIKMGRGGSSYFRVAPTDFAGSFTVGRQGQTSISSPNSNAFRVNTDAFVVDGTNKYLKASEKYNEILVDSTGTIDKLPDTLVATKGYVDANSAVPGASIVANSEAEAQVNGFWRNGNNLYLKTSE